MLPLFLFLTYDSPISLCSDTVYSRVYRVVKGAEVHLLLDLVKSIGREYMVLLVREI